ncbi:MAG TPA: ester cyclase [Candidatus Sulfotelmatobacter sp.]|nr:ester cyclase [Candidatus Sulfotelmatobacter sp.]
MRLLLVFAQCFLIGTLLIAQEQPTSNVSIHARNKAVAMRVFDEIFNQGKFQVANEIYAPGFQNHGLHRSMDLKTDQEAVHAEKKAFPDLRMSVQEMVAEGDKVAVLWTFQGTHSGWGYEGLPPTGTRVEIRGITIWRIVDGRIVEEWSSFSETGAYMRMFAHLKWWLVLAGLLIVILVILVERLVWRMVRKMFAQGTQPILCGLK